MKKIESWKKKELEQYCKRIGVPIDWLINDILWANGFDNWHLREQHAVPEILRFIKSIIKEKESQNIKKHI